MVKRSIEQEIRNKNIEARNGNYERNAVVKNPGTKHRVQRILGDCWQWETNGQCVKGNNCSFRHDMDKRGKSSPSNPSQNSFMRQNERKPSRTRCPRDRSPSDRTSRWPCKDHLRGTCNNSFCEKWHRPECLFYKTKSGCRFGEKCSYAVRQVDEQPSKRSKKNDDKSAVAILKKGDWQERDEARNWEKRNSDIAFQEINCMVVALVLDAVHLVLDNAPLLIVMIFPSCRNEDSSMQHSQTFNWFASNVMAAVSLEHGRPLRKSFGHKHKHKQTVLQLRTRRQRSALCPENNAQLLFFITMCHALSDGDSTHD